MGMRSRWLQMIAGQPHKGVIDLGAGGQHPEVEPGAALSCVASWTPRQSEGTPSPDNPLPISGIGTLRVNPGGHLYSISLGQTVYGGTLDVLTGVMTVEWGVIDLGALTYLTNTDGGGNLYRTLSTRGVITGADWASGVLAARCEIYTPHSGDETYRGVYDYAMGTDRNGQLYIYDSSRHGMTAAQFKTSLAGVLMYYKTLTTQTLTLDPVTIRTYRGTVWGTNADSCLIGVWTH